MTQIVYIASPESQQIHVWQLADSGALALLQTVEVGGQVQPMTLSPDGHHLYVGVRPEFSAITYRIAADGQLTQVGRAALPGSPTHISTDHEGRYLFCASYSNNCVSVSPIDADGVAQAFSQQLPELSTPHSANIDPTNKILLVPCLKEDRIRLFDLSAAGELTPHQQQAVSTKAGAGPRHMAFHPNKQYAYAVNELDSSVNVYAISQQGNHYELVQSLNAMPADFTGTCWAADIHITSNGRFLYISDRTASLLSVFQVAADGSSLTLTGHHDTEEQPRGFNIDGSDRYLIAAGQKSGHIAVHQINPENGALTVLARYPVGKGPMWVTIR